MRTARVVKSSIAAALFAAAIALVMAAPAPAAGEAVNGKRVDLRFPSQPGDMACVTRGIRLASGAYRWRAGHAFLPGLVDHRVGSDTGVLPRGDYLWTDCVVHAGGGGYRHNSYLSGPDGSVPTLSYTFSHPASATLVPTWFGSTLRNTSIDD